MTRAQHVRVANKTYKAYFLYYAEHGAMPDEEAQLTIHQRLFQMAHQYAPQTSFEEFEKICKQRSEKYEQRIQNDIANGVTQDCFRKKPKKTPEEKLAGQKRRLEDKRRRQAKRKARAARQSLVLDLEEDDQFSYIAGYTSGGFPYGLTWEDEEREPREDS